MLNHWLGIDTGGTFTDFVYYDGKAIRIHKVLSTPESPERAILQGLQELNVTFENLQIIHGSTVATNALLEGKGVKTVYIANKGFSDVLIIGRQARRELYNLRPKPHAPLIPRQHSLEINTRLSAQGELLEALDEAELEQLIERVKEINPQAVAINLLFSFLDGRQEAHIKSRLQAACPELFISCSSDVLAEYKEYERGIATALNAYIGPLMQGYLHRLATQLKACVSNVQQPSAAAVQKLGPVLSVLQSSGGTIDGIKAGEYGVNLLLSGPAGGLKGAQYMAALGGEHKLLSFDMGGTSTDVALIEHTIKLTSEGVIGHYPVAVPMVDMHTIGAGGGSIASVDAGGLLSVGPESAGADPGPACYGKGGLRATVTDANLILGRLSAQCFLGSAMRLDVAAAEAALQLPAKSLGLSIQQTADGIIKIANEHMVRALRKISVQRGFDPREFALTCFGGAAGLHVCALADALGMRRAIVPVHAGVLSALGMLVAQPSRDLSHTCIQDLLSSDLALLEALFTDLESRGIEDMRQELRSAPERQRSVDMRYKGQSFTLNLRWNELTASSTCHEGLKRLEQAFHRAHKKTYGHELDMVVELVNLRVNIKGDASPFALPMLESAGKGQRDEAENSAVLITCYGYDQPLKVFQREQLVAQQKIAGPALIMEKVSTTLIDKGWHCSLDDWGNLLLHRD